MKLFDFLYFINIGKLTIKKVGGSIETLVLITSIYA